MAKDIRPIRPGDKLWYKLTDHNMRTFGGYQWDLGVQKRVSGNGPLCGPGWLHIYSHPVVASMLNSMHAAFATPRLFVAHAEGVYRTDRSLKAGVSRLTLVRELPFVHYSRTERTAWAIFVVRQVLVRGKVGAWDRWADSYLSGENRTWGAAADAADTANAAANAANAAADAAYAAHAAANAATNAVAYAANAAAYAATNAAVNFSLLFPTQQFLGWKANEDAKNVNA